MMENPSYHLNNIVRDKDELGNFEGPLSLILLLLAKDKIEIRDLKIADILDQYLEYLSRMQEMDLDIASEFVQMASHLLYIKTKSLLVGEKEVSELEELLESLEQLKAADAGAQIRCVAPQLQQAMESGMLYYEKLPEPLPPTESEYQYSHTIPELLEALVHVFAVSRAPVDNEFINRVIPHRITFSIHAKSQALLDRLKQGDQTVTALYDTCGTRSEMVATFISILELCSAGSVALQEIEGKLMLHLVDDTLSDEIKEKDYN